MANQNPKQTDEANKVAFEQAEEVPEQETPDEMTEKSGGFYTGAKTESEPENEYQETEEDVNFEPISWVGDEYLMHHKDHSWYLWLVVAFLGLSGFIYLITRDLLTVVMIVVVGFAIGVMAARQPRQLEFTLDKRFIEIDQKRYPYSAFKSFQVAEEHGVRYLEFVPIKRLMPPLSIYYPQDKEEEIAKLISAKLPYYEHDDDFIEALFKKIRF
jgi:hypothetical protein